MDHSEDVVAYQGYAIRLARRLVRYRRSAMVDEQDLASAAMTALLEKIQTVGEIEERVAKQTIKYAMLETLRNSALVKTRNRQMEQVLRTYQEISVYDEPRYDPVNTWIDAEPVREVSAIIACLSPEDQLLLSLVWEEGCSLAEVAEVLSISKSRVHQRYSDLIKSVKARWLVSQRRTVR